VLNERKCSQQEGCRIDRVIFIYSCCSHLESETVWTRRLLIDDVRYRAGRCPETKTRTIYAILVQENIWMDRNKLLQIDSY